jgi:hypothetical protein
MNAGFFCPKAGCTNIKKDRRAASTTFKNGLFTITDAIVWEPSLRPVPADGPSVR